MVAPDAVDGAAPSPADVLAISVTEDRLPVEPRDGAICVVDDDPWVRDSLTALLETYGFAVLTFGSGTEFLGEERRHRAGLLIVDQHMPGMDGLAILAALRRTGSDVPAILITGRTDASIAARAAMSGVIAILEKPFATARLVELVRSGLERSR